MYTQGQTLERVSVFLGKPVVNDDGITLERIDDQPAFSNGQLYVALSRVGHPDSARVYLTSSRYASRRTVLVVYTDALLQNTTAVSAEDYDYHVDDDEHILVEDAVSEADDDFSATNIQADHYQALGNSVEWYGDDLPPLSGLSQVPHGEHIDVPEDEFEPLEPETVMNVNSQQYITDGHFAYNHANLSEEAVGYTAPFSPESLPRTDDLCSFVSDGDLYQFEQLMEC